MDGRWATFQRDACLRADSSGLTPTSHFPPLRRPATGSGWTWHLSARTVHPRCTLPEAQGEPSLNEQVRMCARLPIPGELRSTRSSNARYDERLTDAGRFCRRRSSWLSARRCSSLHRTNIELGRVPFCSLSSNLTRRRRSISARATCSAQLSSRQEPMVQSSVQLQSVFDLPLSFASTRS
jgi:hypothetical protein